MKSDEFLRNVCPVCRANEIDVLMDEFRPATLSNHGSASLTRCKSCNFIFYRLGIDARGFDDYYRSMAKYDEHHSQAGGADAEWDRDRIYLTITWVLDLLKIEKDSLIVDIGCGGGGLLLALENEGYSNLIGLDIKDNRSGHAIKSKNINFEKFSFHESIPTKLAVVKPKLIFLTHVLEHIFDLNAALLCLKKLASSETYIYVEVPDASRYHKYYKGPFHYFSEEHINHFDPTTLRLLFETHGFEQVLDFNALGTQKVIKVSSSEFYPATFSIFKVRAHDSIDDYIAKSITELERLREITDRLKALHRFSFWGVGSTMHRFFSSQEGLFNELRPDFIIDSSPKLVGHKFKGQEIKLPECLVGYDGYVVIMATIFYDDIVRQLADISPKAQPLNFKVFFKNSS